MLADLKRTLPVVVPRVTLDDLLCIERDQHFGASAVWPEISGECRDRPVPGGVTAKPARLSHAFSVSGRTQPSARDSERPEAMAILDTSAAS